MNMKTLTIHKTLTKKATNHEESTENIPETRKTVFLDWKHQKTHIFAKKLNTPPSAGKFNGALKAHRLFVFPEKKYKEGNFDN